MDADLQWLVEEFQALWEVTGLAELFAARMLDPACAGGPAEIVLAMHRELLVAALRAEQVSAPQRVADALLGVYLSRRLAGRGLDGWARDAIETVVG